MTQSLTQRFLTARRAAIAGCFADLNPQQQEAVLTTQGPLLVLAGAGSGKTTVLIRRVANLLQFGAGSDTQLLPQDLSEEAVETLETYLQTKDPALQQAALALCAWEPVAPWRIIAITFTNKAAGELKNRLCSLLGPKAESVWAMTFHAACCRILRRDAERLGYTSSFTIYDSGDSQSVIKSILKDRDWDPQTFPPKTVASIISRAKDLRQDPADYAAAQRGDDWRQQAAQLYAEYQTRLKAANAMDFDDLLLNTVALLEQNPDILDYYQEKFRYVLVDEYQDTNPLQYQLTALLAGKHQNICVVGDDDQSIYRFRGATIENILSFEQNYPGARVIRLEQNYRSTGNILHAANEVISHNRGRKGKTLWTDKPKGDRLKVYEADSETAEANWVAQQILSGLSKKRPLSDYAVLYRTNTQSNALEAAFRRTGVPYRIIGGTRFYDRAEVKDMLAYLWVLNNRADDLRLLRIINNPPRGLGGKTLETVEALAERNQVPLYNIVSDPYSYPELSKSAGKLMAFTILLEELAETLTTLSLPDFYQAMMERTGYLAMLQEKKDDQSRNRLENIQELGSTILSYVKDTDEPSLGGFLEEVSLYTDIEQYDPDADAAVMMTIHGAKGLEFPQVFLVGLEEGLFPSAKSRESSEDLEEERRLCYVALTRAKENLFLSYARSRMLYGKTTSNRPSGFLSELPEEGVQWLNRRWGQGVTLLDTDVQEFYSDDYGSSYRGYGSYGSYGSRQGGGYGQSARPAGGGQRQPVPKTASKTVKSGTAALTLRVGDTVQHKSFGRGVVLTVQAMGNDALVEIAFDGQGTKKLMLNTAAKFLTKL